ncbi:MAG TPA: PQQ-dependent sugar dehydrogenase, partial [Longimicrobiales bacterium]|nr:PQQ-dependent sugar dehydrogenase [Longimicrobiales bacterium]
MRHACLPLITLLALGACTSPSGTSGENSGEVQPTEPTFAIEAFESFDEPWAMAFRPGTETLFITEQGGAVRSYDTRTGRLGSIASGIPDVDYGGQGGLGDIAFHPEADAQDPPMLYLTWVEAGPGGTRGAALGRGLLTCDQAGSCELRDFETLWRQD